MLRVYGPGSHIAAHKIVAVVIVHRALELMAFRGQILCLVKGIYRAFCSVFIFGNQWTLRYP